MELKVTLLDGGRRFRLEEPLILEDVVGLTACHVPEGFTTNGASVPRIFMPIIPPFGNRYTEAAILHDYMYRTGTLCTWARGPVAISRRRADMVFLRVLSARGCRPWRKWTMYIAVRLFGSKYYAK